MKTKKYIIKIYKDSYLKNTMDDTYDVDKAKRFKSYKQAYNYAIRLCPAGYDIIEVEK